MRAARVNDMQPLLAGEVSTDRIGALPESSQALLALWDRDRQGNAVPSAVWIDPLHLWRWLGRLVVTEIVHERYRYRIFGSEIALNAGYDLSGTWMDQNIETEVTSLFRPHYEAARTTGTAFHSEHIRISAGLKITRLVLPYARHGDAADTVVVHYSWSNIAGTALADKSGVPSHTQRLRSWQKARGLQPLR